MNIITFLSQKMTVVELSVKNASGCTPFLCDDIS